MNIVTEIQIVPIKPENGLIAFCSFVLYESIYCSSVGIFSRQNGDCRLVYPTKRVGLKAINIFHPISREIGNLIEQEVTKIYKDVMNNDRYNITYNSTEGF